MNRSVRFRILKRDGFKCTYCGRSPPEVALQVDHDLPRSKGGSDRDANLRTSCRDCNIGKSNDVTEREVRRELVAQLLAHLPSDHWLLQEIRGHLMVLAALPDWTDLESLSQFDHGDGIGAVDKLFSWVEPVLFQERNDEYQTAADAWSHILDRLRREPKDDL